LGRPIEEEHNRGGGCPRIGKATENTNISHQETCWMAWGWEELEVEETIKR